MSKKLTKEQQLYIDKQLEFTEELYNKSDEQLKEAFKQQLNNRDEILTEIANTMLSYNIADSKLSIGSIEKQKLKEKLSKFIRDKIQGELVNETNLTDVILKSTGKEKYNINNYLHDIGMNVSWDIKPVDDTTLKNIINTKVDNKLWSDRLWDNKNVLQKDLKLEIEDFLNGKTSVNEIEAKIKKKYNSNAYNTKRLIQDNVCRVQEGMNDVWREEHNIKRVLYMATLCNNTCGNCGQYDNKDYQVDQKPILLPQHPFCHCTYVNIPNAGWRPKMRLDNETKEKINWQSYKEWEKEYIKSTGAIGKIHKNEYLEENTACWY
ncbi:phage head morphogenesis protein [Clostridium botulinum]|uniref:phage head morphogenesis protein n=1 Tax=Clostridium botulinum TaxID=1491 RepID=UPI001C9AE236|nr:phage head morphogenesis protein [Clostridium botulinum]MBY6915405.1 phage head morphogenesis protein [Clostridium botulinum]